MDLYYFNHFMLKERQRRRMSQEAFADKLGITKQAISNIELYKNKVAIETVSKFCEEFGFRLYFQTFKKPGKPDTNA
jgi:transcriptional regulator with XRE-family HTH domain